MLTTTKNTVISYTFSCNLCHYEKTVKEESLVPKSCPACNDGAPVKYSYGRIECVGLMRGNHTFVTYKTIDLMLEALTTGNFNSAGSFEMAFVKTSDNNGPHLHLGMRETQEEFLKRAIEFFEKEKLVKYE